MFTYATFWQRLAAACIDFMLWLGVVLLVPKLEHCSKVFAWALVLPTNFLFVGYAVYCHGRFGQTLGKAIMRIALTRTDGTSVGWRRAWLRSSVDIVFQSLSAVAEFVALARISESDYYSANALKIRLALEPACLAWAVPAMGLWFWSEMVTMLFNRKRRALHDFIAGTIVVSKARTSVHRLPTKTALDDAEEPAQT